ncbi:MAG: formylglycine-generating enzyme family protein, partial [Candidatus Coatesbacteria bacterium]|nr:formylglycine-generating enzyme family protein [Candidatus Coatesbacteria bacterium]
QGIWNLLPADCTVHWKVRAVSPREVGKWSETWRFVKGAGTPDRMTMVEIPAGSFLMGSPSDESERDSDEGPQRTVNISAFQMSATEITEWQFEHVMGWIDCCHDRGDNYPVEYVTWYDCVSFCNVLSQAEGLDQCYSMTDMDYEGRHITYAEVSCNFDANGYRLPTEAEWEYACRAGTTTRFHSGDSDSDLGPAGWYSANSNSQKQEVADREPNAWGLYDMHGNCYEWCWDYYASNYYGTRPNPDSDPTGDSYSLYRSLRGGSWYSNARYCRSANRAFDYARYAYSNYSFRVVKSSD